MAEQVKAPIPKWAWLFFVACVAIPIVSMGGAIPGAIGGGGAFACLALARNSTKSLNIRLAACVGITVLCWVLFLALIVGVAAMQSR